MQFLSSVMFQKHCTHISSQWYHHECASVFSSCSNTFHSLSRRLQYVTCSCSNCMVMYCTTSKVLLDCIFHVFKIVKKKSIDDKLQIDATRFTCLVKVAAFSSLHLLLLSVFIFPLISSLIIYLRRVRCEAKQNNVCFFNVQFVMCN